MKYLEYEIFQIWNISNMKCLKYEIFVLDNFDCFLMNNVFTLKVIPEQDFHLKFSHFWSCSQTRFSLDIHTWSDSWQDFHTTIKFHQPLSRRLALFGPAVAFALNPFSKESFSEQNLSFHLRQSAFRKYLPAKQLWGVK